MTILRIGVVLSAVSLLLTYGCAAWNIGGNDGTDPARHFLGTTDNRPLVVKTRNNPAMLIDARGNVGIGTTSPERKLQVDSGADHVAARFGSNTVASAIVFRNSSTKSDSVMVGAQGDSLRLVTNATDRVVVRANGDVGIGTLTPNAKLEIGGQVKITGGNPGGGKVLTSDAEGLASWQTPFAVAIRTSQFDIGPRSMIETGASCEVNEIATGGGFQAIDDPNLNVWKNRPLGSSGWAIGVSNYGDVARTVSIHVICLQVD